MWLTGGPGCSSEIALFYENGPFSFDEKNKSLIYNEYSWNNISNLLFVDNPVGTGFSKTSIDYDTDELHIAKHMKLFI
jgi:carboxypeptidase C (cathepsin A)